MGIFLLRRFATFLATLAGASIVIFVVLEVLPGNAAQIILGTTATPEAVHVLEHKLGLDQPLTVRYLGWVGGMLTGDFGVSYAYGTPVAGLIGQALALTAPLALMAMLVNCAIGLAAGVFAASRHNRLGDVGVMALSQLGIAIPNFWFAILLVLLFAVTLGWFPAGGFPGWEDDFWGSIQALILPALALGVVQAAVLARTTRSAVLEVFREDFVRTARAKGLTRRAVLWRHVLRNALIPVVTIMGLQFANLIVFTVIIESVFYLPGLGQLAFKSISNRDIAVVRDVVMLFAAMVIGVNFIVDLLYAAIDPRVKAHGL